MRTFQSNPLLKEKQAWVIIAWSVLVFFASAYNLNDFPPYHSDEYLYIQSAERMVATGDYLTPKSPINRRHDPRPEVQYKNRYNKPILTYWLMAGSIKAFGEHLAAARLFSAVFGALCVWVTFLWARRLFDGETAFFAALILPGFLLHFQIARLARPDMVLTFFILAALYFFTLGHQSEDGQRKNYLLSHLCASLGFLTKGPIALIFSWGPIILFLLLTGNRSRIRELRLGLGFLMVLGINLPWFLAMAALHGGHFLNHLWGVELAGRVTRWIGFQPYFLGALFRFYFPWSLFLISALILYSGLIPNLDSGGKDSPETKSFAERVKLRWKILYGNRAEPLIFCLIFMGLHILIFTLWGDEHMRYLAPLSPVLAILLGHFFSMHFNSESGMNRATLKAPLFLTLVSYPLIAIALSVILFIIQPVLQIPVSMILPPIFLLAGSGALIYFWRRKTKTMLVLLCVLQTGVITFYCGSALPFFNGSPMKKAAGTILDSGIANERIFLYKMNNDAPKLGMRTFRWVRSLSDPGLVRRLMDSPHKAYFVMRETDWAEEFADKKLTRLGTDVRFRAVKLKKFLPAIKEKGFADGIRYALSQKVMEKLVVLRN